MLFICVFAFSMHTDSNRVLFCQQLILRELFAVHAHYLFDINVYVCVCAFMHSNNYSINLSC